MFNSWQTDELTWDSAIINTRIYPLFLAWIYQFILQFPVISFLRVIICDSGRANPVISLVKGHMSFKKGSLRSLCSILGLKTDLLVT
jgi:hypothetical protein